jgi:hypothetical protein
MTKKNQNSKIIKNTAQLRIFTSCAQALDEVPTRNIRQETNRQKLTLQKLNQYYDD